LNSDDIDGFTDVQCSFLSRAANLRAFKNKMFTLDDLNGLTWHQSVKLTKIIKKVSDHVESDSSEATQTIKSKLEALKRGEADPEDIDDDEENFLFN